MSDEIIKLLLSGLMGIFGGMITIPINALFSWYLKKDEQLNQHRLDMIAKKSELLLQHKLEMEAKGRNTEIVALKSRVAKLEEMLLKNE